MILGTQRLKNSQSIVQKGCERNNKGKHQHEHGKGKLQQITCSIIINPQKIKRNEHNTTAIQQSSSMQQLIREKYNFSSPSIRQGNLNHCNNPQKMTSYNNTINQMRLSTLRRKKNRENSELIMNIWNKNSKLRRGNNSCYRNDLVNQKINHSLLVVLESNDRVGGGVDNSNNMAESIMLPQLKRLNTQGDQPLPTNPKPQQPYLTPSHTAMHRRRIANCIIERGWAKKMQASLVRIRSERMRMHSQQQQLQLKQQVSFETKLNFNHNRNNIHSQRKTTTKLLSPLKTSTAHKHKQFIAPFTTTTSRNSNHPGVNFQHQQIISSTDLQNSHHKKQHSIDPW